MRGAHPRPRRSHPSTLARVLDHVVRALHDDARAAVHSLQLYPGAPVVDPHTGAAIEGWAWARRHMMYGPTEALFLLDEDDKALATILPPSLSAMPGWSAEPATPELGRRHRLTRQQWASGAPRDSVGNSDALARSPGRA